MSRGWRRRCERILTADDKEDRYVYLNHTGGIAIGVQLSATV
jgi:hypothetical protein